MKVLVTGSHFTPAQAVIEKLLEIPDLEIVYLGRKYARDDDNALSVESKILPGLGVKFIPIIAGKLNRFFSFGTIISFLKTPVGFIQSFYYLLKEQPDVIVSFGGFTGMPVVICGWFLSVPSLIHEQSLKMGLANSVSRIFTQKIALSFPPESGDKESAKITVTGNPIRKELLSPGSPSKGIKNFITLARKNKKPIILVTAGNQGSHFINLIVEDKLQELIKFTNIIHQTGDSKFDDYSNLEKHQSGSYLVNKWINAGDLSFILDDADLVVSRAGINTLLELAFKSVPALMVPIPVGNEQKNNAAYFKRLGLGEVMPEKDITPDVFIKKIKEMLNQKPGLKQLAIASKKAVVLDAENKLVQEILIMLENRTNFPVNFK